MIKQLTIGKRIAATIMAFLIAFSGLLIFPSHSFAANGDQQAKSFKVTQTGGSKKVAKDAKLTFKCTEKKEKVKIKIYYFNKKTKKYAYHSTVYLTTGKKSDGAAQAGYTGSVTIKGKNLTKGFKYKAEAANHGGAWYKAWTAK